MITRYRRLAPSTAGLDAWVAFSYDDVAQEITLYNSAGRGFNTYSSSRAELGDWVRMSTHSGLIALDIDEDMTLDEGL